MDYCDVCGKAAKVNENGLCKKCKKDWVSCQKCGEFFGKGQLRKGMCKICYEREEK